MNLPFNKTKVVIIGAGPAGITAAVQLKRLNIDFVLIEKDAPGGLIRTANLIENYPGFPAGISGRKFAELLAVPLNRHEIGYIKDEVKTINFEGNQFVVQLTDTQIISEYLIIATGTNPNKIENIDIDDNCRKRIFSELIFLDEIDKAELLQSEFAIIGSGDAAFDYALNLKGRGCRASVFMRTQRSKALQILQDRVKNSGVSGNAGIELYSEYELFSVKNDSGSGNLVLCFDNKGTNKEYTCSYTIFAVGRHPNLDFLSPALMQSSDGLKKENRLFFVGDVNNRDRQLAIAAGEAMKAAMTIYRELNHAK